MNAGCELNPYKLIEREMRFLRSAEFQSHKPIVLQEGHTREAPRCRGMRNCSMRADDHAVEMRRRRRR
jgi:hypothetical protein